MAGARSILYANLRGNKDHAAEASALDLTRAVASSYRSGQDEACFEAHALLPSSTARPHRDH